jgi:hypothetical protein
MSLTKEHWETSDNNNDIMSEEEASQIMAASLEANDEVVAEQEHEAPMASKALSLDHTADYFVEEDEEADEELFTNARLRLEQGRLYEMLLRHDLFGDVEADERVIKNVEREIKSFIKERLEVLLGLKPDPRLVSLQVTGGSSQQFTSLEVDLLKKLLSKATGGATSKASGPEAAPKGNTLPRINAAPQTSRPPQKLQQAVSRPQSKPTAQRQQPQAQTPIARPKQAQPKTTEEPAPLTKPVHEMTREELIQRDKLTAERIRSKMAPKPTNAIPMPSAEQQAAMYMTRFTGESNPIAKALMAHIKPAMISTVSQDD